MPRAAAGTTKALSNQMKSKGLQRLRWYCQACEKQCRDENGFKCHTMSESHVRTIQGIGADPRAAINEFSEEFKRNFLLQLRTGHGTKPVHINHFYQTLISDKQHIHMNATKWPSLTEFAKYLGREGICRVEETEKGLHIAWIDNSPEALRRQDALRKKERMERGDEERETQLIKEQVRRAQQEVEPKEEEDEEARRLHRTEGEKIKLSFGAKPAAQKDSPPAQTPQIAKEAVSNTADKPSDLEKISTLKSETSTSQAEIPNTQIKMSLGQSSSKPKNVFATQKKSSAAPKKSSFVEPVKRMSEAERIMNEDLERKRSRETTNFKAPIMKRQRVT